MWNQERKKCPIITYLYAPPGLPNLLIKRTAPVFLMLIHLTAFTSQFSRNETKLSGKNILQNEKETQREKTTGHWIKLHVFVVRVKEGIVSSILIIENIE